MKTKRKSRSGSLVELAGIVVVAVGLALAIQAFLVKPYRIPSGSMLPTLALNQRVLVNRIGNRFTNPKVGEIMVFHPPQGAIDGRCGNIDEGPNSATGGPRSHEPCSRPTPQESDQNFIKRVVGLPGDKIAVRDGHAVRNGAVQKESYILPCGGGSECNLNPITVPPDHYFMMGDNRGDSDDSRYWGPVPKQWIIGGAFATYWPPNRVGLL